MIYSYVLSQPSPPSDEPALQPSFRYDSKG